MRFFFHTDHFEAIEKDTKNYNVVKSVDIKGKMLCGGDGRSGTNAVVLSENDAIS